MAHLKAQHMNRCTNHSDVSGNFRGTPCHEQLVLGGIYFSTSVCTFWLCMSCRWPYRRLDRLWMEANPIACAKRRAGGIDTASRPATDNCHGDVPIAI